LNDITGIRRIENMINHAIQKVENEI
jgi:hypothetical protein